MKRLKFLSFLLLLLVAQVQSQEEVKSYLDSSEPLMVRLQQTVQGFLDEVQPLREKKDIVGLKAVSDNYIGVWDGLLEELAGVTPPAEAQEHYSALKTLFQMQRENSVIMSETLAYQLNLISELQKMREGGATDEEVKEHAAVNGLDKEALLERTSTVKAATKEADAKLKAEHQRLTEMVAGDKETEG